MNSESANMLKLYELCHECGVKIIRADLPEMMPYDALFQRDERTLILRKGEISKATITSLVVILSDSYMREVMIL